MNTQKHNPMEMILIVLSATLFTCFVSLFFLGYIPMKQENQELKRDLNYCNTTYLRKQGWTSFMGGPNGLSYDLRSFDAGKTWYAIKINDSDTTEREVVILGRADSIYPDLLQHLDSWDTLTNHVRKYGPIGSHKITETDRKVLEDAGFKIKNN